jgi:hypothetical protein
LNKLQTLSNDTRSIQREGFVGTWTASLSEESTENTDNRDNKIPKEGITEMESDPTSETSLPKALGSRAVQDPCNSTQDALLSSLHALKLALPRRKAQYNPALQELSNMTALITSKMYAPRVHSGIEGEVRKEIRAAKGLLLNRSVKGKSYENYSNVLVTGKRSSIPSLPLNLDRIKNMNYFQLQHTIIRTFDQIY